MAARTHNSHPKAPYRPMYGDGASLHLYAGSNQDMISLSPDDWNPTPAPAQMDDLFLEIRCTFMNLYNQSNPCEKESESV